MAPRQPKNEKQRRNIPVEGVNMKEANRRQLTFLNRKPGLFNKLTELTTLCNAETALIIEAPNDKQFYVCGPSADDVIHQFVTGSRPPWGRTSHLQERIEPLRAKYEAEQEELKDMESKLEELQEESRRGVFSRWWETSIDDLDLDSIVQLEKAMENMKLNLMMRLHEGKNNNIAPRQLSDHNNALPPHLQPVVLAPKPEVPLTNFKAASELHNCRDSRQQVSSGSRMEGGGVCADHYTSRPPFPPPSLDDWEEGDEIVPYDESMMTNFIIDEWRRQQQNNMG